MFTKYLKDIKIINHAYDRLLHDAQKYCKHEISKSDLKNCSNNILVETRRELTLDKDKQIFDKIIHSYKIYSTEDSIMKITSFTKEALKHKKLRIVSKATSIINGLNRYVYKYGNTFFIKLLSGLDDGTAKLDSIDYSHPNFRDTVRIIFLLKYGIVAQTTDVPDMKRHCISHIFKFMNTFLKYC